MRRVVILLLSAIMLITVCVAITSSDFQTAYVEQFNPEAKDTKDVMAEMIVTPEVVLPIPEEKHYDGTVYLTFDDGPTNEITPQILDILKEHEVLATFFVLGSYAKRVPEVLKREFEEGHTIGNHSYSHQKSMFSSIDKFKSEIEKTNSVISEITGEIPKFFRFPYGTKVGKAFKDYLSEKELTVINWNCESSDSHSTTIKADAILASVKRTVKDQKEVIVIMHDTYGKQETVKALPQIIEYFKELNYEFKSF